MQLQSIFPTGQYGDNGYSFMVQSGSQYVAVATKAKGVASGAWTVTPAGIAYLTSQSSVGITTEGDQLVMCTDVSRLRVGACSLTSGDLYTLLGGTAASLSMVYETHNFSIGSDGMFGVRDETSDGWLKVSTEGSQERYYYVASGTAGVAPTAGNFTLKSTFDYATGALSYGVVNPVTKFCFWPAFTTASGTDSACSNGDRYWTSIVIPYSCTLTGLAYLIGSVGGTNSVIVELHDNAGVLLATSALAGATVGTANTMQQVAFTAPVVVSGPAVVYMAVQFNGTTAKFKTVPATALGLANTLVTGTSAGTFGTSAAITPGTSFVADKGPIVSTY